MGEDKKRKEKQNKKIVFIILLILFLSLLSLFIILILRSCINNSSPKEENNEISEIETYNKLINIANKKVDELDGLYKDEKYDSNKILSFTYKNNDVSYSTYNDNYLVNISFKVDSTDVISAILNDNFSEISTQIYDKFDFSLSDNTYYQNTFISNATTYVGRITAVNHLSGTYIGKDESIYSFTNIEFDNGDPCPYQEDSSELSIYKKDNQNIIYKLLYKIAQ